MVDEHYKDHYIKLTDWVSKKLSEKIIDINEVVATRYSYVLQIKTASNIYYLKHAPGALYVEKDILDFFTQNKFPHVPYLLFYDDDLTCFLMRACGDIALREHYKDKFDASLFQGALENYINIQKSSAIYKDELLDTGVPCWSFPDLYAEMLNDEKYMQWLDLGQDRLAQLKNRQTILKDLCAELDSYNLPEVLNHADFQDNNTVIYEGDHTLAIIDWGEVYWGNPLISAYSALIRLTYFDTVEKNSDEYHRLLYLVFESWDIPENKHAELDQLLYIFNNIYYVLIFYNLSKMIDYNFPDWRERLQTPLNNFLDRTNQ